MTPGVASLEVGERTLSGEDWALERPELALCRRLTVRSGMSANHPLRTLALKPREEGADIDREDRGDEQGKGKLEGEPTHGQAEQSYDCEQYMKPQVGNFRQLPFKHEVLQEAGQNHEHEAREEGSPLSLIV
jgi:hypothetical protein